MDARRIVIQHKQTGEKAYIEQGRGFDGNVWQFVEVEQASNVAAVGYKVTGAALRTVGKMLGINCAPCKLRDAVMAKVSVLGTERANDFLRRTFRVVEGTPEFDALAKEITEALREQG